MFNSNHNNMKISANISFTIYDEFGDKIFIGPYVMSHAIRIAKDLRSKNECFTSYEEIDDNGTLEEIKL